MVDVKKRELEFSKKFSTNIWKEESSLKNAYIPEKVLLHGYDFFELNSKTDYADMLFLLLSGSGELPSKTQKRLFESYLKLLISLGPRSAPVQAAVTASVSKSHAGNILPIGLATLAGEFLGVEQLLKSYDDIYKKSDHLNSNLKKLNGFGTRFGGVDSWTTKLVQALLPVAPEGGYLAKCNSWVGESDREMGWLITGVCASVFLDLGIKREHCAGLYQFTVSPGIIAHSSEYRTKHMTALSFVDDEDYSIE